MWRVPLSAPPSSEWQHSFQSAEESTAVASPKAVRFEREALTFRAGEEHVPAWVACIDRWIADANQAQAGLEERRGSAAARAQAQTDARRQQATDANERFKDL